MMRAVFLCALFGVVSGVRVHTPEADKMSADEDAVKKYLAEYPVNFEGVEYTKQADVVAKLTQMYGQDLALMKGWEMYVLNDQGHGHKQLREVAENPVPDTIEGIVHQLNDTITRRLRSRHSDAELDSMKQMQARALAGDKSKSTSLEGSLAGKLDSVGPRKIKDIWSTSNVDESKNAKGYKYEGFGFGGSLGGLNIPTPEEMLSWLPKEYGPFPGMWPQHADGKFKDFGALQASDAYYLRLQNGFMQLDWAKATEAICHDPIVWSTWAIYLQVAYVNAGNKAHAACQANQYSKDNMHFKAIDNVWQGKAKAQFNQRINWNTQNQVAAFKIINTVGFSREENVKQMYTAGGSAYKAEDAVYGSPWFQVLGPLLAGNGWMNVGNLLAASTD